MGEEETRLVAIEELGIGLGRGFGGRGRALAIDTVEPGNAESAGLDTDDDAVAFVEAVIVIGIHGEAFKTATGSPGADEDAAGAADDAGHLIAAVHDGGVIDDVFVGIEPAVEEENGGEDEGDRDEAGEEMAEDFDVAASVGAAVEVEGEEEAGEEDDTEEDEHGVNIERSVELADVGEEERTGEKESKLAKKAAAKDDLRGGGGEAADGALIAGALGAAIQATGHRKQYTAGSGGG